MRIAQIAPLYESVPPRLYGGTERVVAWLADALVEAGHEVTLYASAESGTRAAHVPIDIPSLRLAATGEPDAAAHFRMLEEVMRHVGDYDVLHFHTDFMHYPFIRRRRCVHLTTLHGRLDLPGLVALYNEYADEPVVSISDDQRRPLPCANWVGTIYHGMPPDLLAPSFERGAYLAFLGRISPEKAPDAAIRIAARAGMPLRIAAKVDPVDRSYFETVVGPMLDDPLVEFVGEVDERGKAELLRGAAALVFPIAWPEPFGLVMIEAMACGTPVIATRRGSVPELIDEGVTGFVVADEDGAVDALARAQALDRRAVRRRFEERFTADRMAADYERLYERLIKVRTLPNGLTRGAA